MIFPESYRFSFVGTPWVSEQGDDFGAFIIPAIKAPGRRTLRCIASSGLPEIPWEHVSVSIYNAPKQTPTWAEMCFVKDLFWTKDKVVIQYHPDEKDYVNFHPGTLHLWRPISTGIPVPPSICVGPL